MRGYVAQRRNRFYAVIYEGIDPITGRERRRWHPAGTDREQAKELATALASAQSQRIDGRRVGPTFGVYLTMKWLPAKQLTLRPSTWDGYRRLIELHVLLHLGRVPLRHLRAEHLDRLYAKLLERGRCNCAGGLDIKTVHEIHIVIRRALRDAEKRGSIVRNPAEIAHAPKRRPLTSSEFEPGTRSTGRISRFGSQQHPLRRFVASRQHGHAPRRSPGAALGRRGSRCGQGVGEPLACLGRL